MTRTSAETKGCRKPVYKIGAVEVSPVGGFLQRSVLGGANNTKEPIYSGMASSDTFSALKDPLAGVIVGMVKNGEGDYPQTPGRVE